MTTPAARLREMLSRPGLVTAPGAFSPLTARLVAEAGFPAVYLTGAGVAGGLFGEPDLGLVTLTELADAARRCVDASGLPLICDADTGFGGVLNVRRTVRLLEQAGVAALHLEDQAFPRRCGFLEGQELVDAEDMVMRLDAALQARRDPDTMIVARTEVLGARSLDETVERARRYAEAGADMIFCNGVTSAAEAETLAARIDAPQIFNVSTSGRTPHLAPERLEALGYRIVIYPAHALFLSLRAVEDMLADLKATGTLEAWLPRMYDFDRWKQVSGVLEAEAFEDRTRRR